MGVDTQRVATGIYGENSVLHRKFIGWEPFISPLRYFNVTGQQFFQTEVIGHRNFKLLDFGLPQVIDHFFAEIEVERSGVGQEGGTGQTVAQQLHFLEF